MRVRGKGRGKRSVGSAYILSNAAHVLLSQQKNDRPPRDLKKHQKWRTTHCYTTTASPLRRPTPSTCNAYDAPGTEANCTQEYITLPVQLAEYITLPVQLALTASGRGTQRDCVSVSVSGSGSGWRTGCACRASAPQAESGTHSGCGSRTSRQTRYA